MNSNLIILDYLNYVPASVIAEKYGLDVKSVKIILRSSLSRRSYMSIAHKIGAKSVHKKLQNPEFRRHYSEKMRRSVSESLQLKMRDEVFSDGWSAKAKKASVKGNKEIKRLLGDSSFYRMWVEKCSLGGKSIKSQKKGIFDPSRQEDRARWSYLGLQNTGRKKNGPRGERMYNSLEVQVAREILKSGFTYDYEKTFNDENINGFFSVDFELKEIPLIIEVTYWDDVLQKSLLLTRKFIRLKHHTPNHSFVVVTKPSMCEHYKGLLPDYVTVLSAKQLGHFMAGFRFSKRSGVTNSEKWNLP